MLKVMLVDDEPFILRGLSLLIDWREQGFEIVKTASNGLDALEYLRREKVHLVLADIRMPGMTGLELVETLRKEQGAKRPYFAIMSGYNDFEYARQAICNACLDYILKPVSRADLLALLQRVQKLYREAEEKKAEETRNEKAFFTRRLTSVLYGKHDPQTLDYVRERLHLHGGLRFVLLQPDGRDEKVRAMDDQALRRCQGEMYAACLSFLGAANAYHCVFDATQQRGVYDVCVLYSDALAEADGCDEQAYFDRLRERVNAQTGVPVLMFIGDRVATLETLDISVRSAIAARVVESFRMDALQADSENGGKLCKQTLDALIQAVEQGDAGAIAQGVDGLCNALDSGVLDAQMITVNVNYLLFQLVYLAVQQDENVNQEEILRYITANTYAEGALRGGREYLNRFANEYAGYLAQLRSRNVGGVLAKIEREVRENYTQNLTLKELSRKYYINSAYLGQIFRKKYGVSFKEYLNEYRVERAAELLLHTDKKVMEIAGAVGYRDPDYFINRFIASRGCTPARFRKQARDPGA